jgi:hypothetical protein
MSWLAGWYAHTSYSTPNYTHEHIMDSQALAIALDRLKFYAKDAAFTLSQVSREPILRARAEN